MSVATPVDARPVGGRAIQAAGPSRSDQGLVFFGPFHIASKVGGWPAAQAAPFDQIWNRTTVPASTCRSTAARTPPPSPPGSVRCAGCGEGGSTRVGTVC